MTLKLNLLGRLYREKNYLNLYNILINIIIQIWREEILAVFKSQLNLVKTFVPGYARRLFPKL